ncbi:hypothetical protein GCM10010172_22040 [Paractinoplanes ferrugineus]|uniref:Ig-like domain repeat protein n=2 Tax=Paractinoplanes ferrugineus TaxID=113564 RepID=A0A919IUS3_9ACTN|nr:hypothetical protein Afe05nite_07250 [Actinoplanes ferrugineus]
MSASAAEVTTSLPGTSFSAVLVDDAHGHVYVTGADKLAVLDPYGALQQQVPLSGAAGMTLDGSTLYVALAQNGIAALDTATLAVERTFPTPAGSGICPAHLAATGGRVYFTYGCADSHGGLGSLDPATGTMTLGLGAATPDARPVAAAGGKLVTSADDGIDLYDLSGGTPALITSATPCTAPNTLAFNSGRILASCQAPSKGLALSATDLSVTGEYGSNNQPPVGIAGSADGSTVAVVTTTDYAPTVWVSSATGAALHDFPLPAGETIDYRGVGLSGTGSTAYAVSHLSHAYKLHVFTAEAQTPALTLTGPAKLDAGRPVTLTGTFGGGAGKQLAVTRTDLAGRHSLAAVTTAAGGAFTVTDKPGGGDNVYAVSFAGDDKWGPARASATVVVARRATAVSLRTDHSLYSYRAAAEVTIRLAGTSGTVCLANTTGQSTCTGTDRAGVARLSFHPMTHNTVLTASFAGNSTFAPASAKVRVHTSAQVQETLRGTRLGVLVQPYRPGATVRFTEQAVVHGKWRTVGTRTARLDGNSRAISGALGTIGRDRVYRVRASFVADGLNAASDGAWKTFRTR